MEKRSWESDPYELDRIIQMVEMGRLSRESFKLILENRSPGKPEKKEKSNTKQIKK